MCYKCGKEWIPLKSEYPCGPCPNKWICPDCGEICSPCCGAKIIDYDGEDDGEDYSDTLVYCGNEMCSSCGRLCHCGGCI